MNSLKGKIIRIEVSGQMSLVSGKGGQLDFKSIVIETPDSVDYLIEDGDILVLFKETEVIVGLGDDLKISLRNKMKGVISSLEKGKVVARLTIETSEGEIISLITANAVNNLRLEEGKEVVAMVKTNEILLSAC